jgi:hypothetical protein
MNITIRDKRTNQKWKLWRNKQQTLWTSFGNRLSKQALFKVRTELGWNAYSKRISLLSSTEPGILFTIVLHDDWFKCNKKIKKFSKHYQQKRPILIR